MDFYNRDKLIKISVVNADISVWYSFRKEVKIMGFVVQKAGIYDDIFGHYLGDKAPENHFIKDGEVYEKTKVLLYYQDGYKKRYYFDTNEGAVTFKEEIVSIGNWLL